MEVFLVFLLGYFEFFYGVSHPLNRALRFIQLAKTSIQNAADMQRKRRVKNPHIRDELVQFHAVFVQVRSLFGWYLFRPMFSSVYR